MPPRRSRDRFAIGPSVYRVDRDILEIFGNEKSAFQDGQAASRGDGLTGPPQGGAIGADGVHDAVVGLAAHCRLFVGGSGCRSGRMNLS
jgi:hypothetical protein